MSIRLAAWLGACTICGAALLRAVEAEPICPLYAGAQYLAGKAPVSVALGDVDGDRIPDLAVANRLSNTVSVLKGNGNATFSSAVSYNVGVEPTCVKLASVDADGDLDLIVANSISGTVSILKNNGAGAFSSAESFAAGPNSGAMASADVDLDGDVDLITANAFDDTLSHLTNTGSGTFSAPVVMFAGDGPRDLVLHDFDGDSDADLVAVHANDDTLAVFRNRTVDARSPAAGLFAIVDVFPVGDGPRAIAVADFNADGRLDLAVANENGDDVSVLLNVDDPALGPQFSAPVAFVTGDRPLTAAAGDVDGDGRPDLVTGCRHSADAQILKNTTDPGGTEPSFAAPAAFIAGPWSTSIAVADLDNDGDNDLTLANELGDSISVMKNSGDGAVTPPPTISAGSTPLSIVSADLDGDGDLDLAASSISSTSIQIWLGAGEGAFDAPISVAAGFAPHRLYAADVSGDGRVDLIAPSGSAPGLVTVLLNQGNRRGVPIFASPATYPTGPVPVAIGIIDYDGDNDIDLAVANADGASVTLLRNLGDFPGENGIFFPVATLPANEGPTDIAVGDLDNDQNEDVIVANVSLDKISVLKNIGAAFAAPITHAVADGPNGVALADLDSDGDLDVAVTNAINDKLSILKNNGPATGGALAAAVHYDVPESPLALHAANVDDDGDVDLIVLHGLTDNISILRNLDGSGGGSAIMGVPITYAAGSNPQSFAVGDFNADGHPDIAAATAIAPDLAAARILLLFHQAPDDDTDGDGVLNCDDICPGFDDALDTDANGTPDGCEPPPPNAADLNGDGAVDGADLGLLLAAWGSSSPGDLNGDGTVDGADLGLLLAAWG
jgi:hypothetical protein